MGEKSSIFLLKNNSNLDAYIAIIQEKFITLYNNSIDKKVIFMGMENECLDKYEREIVDYMVHTITIKLNIFLNRYWLLLYNYVYYSVLVKGAKISVSL